ncbi:MAG TPA: energy transducer TonB [Verrucomicrobiae bacterium]|jgi:protein TonB|nr:energy transducer TonB [Verrucomicrobiae bacterium]
MDANRIAPQRELKDELARFCLPSANRDPDRKLAWANSICILFLLIGLVGGKTADVSIKSPPPLEEVIPTIVEPLPPPNQAEEQKPDENEPQKNEVAQAVVVMPEAPDINLSIPTVGNLIAPSAMATAPPLNPMQTSLNRLPANLSSTGTGGERPQPPYPKIALEQGEQGSTVLSITADATGNITAIEIKESSGYPMLDRSALDFVKRHWTVPAGSATRIYEATVTYKLTLN